VVLASRLPLSLRNRPACSPCSYPARGLGSWLCPLLPKPLYSRQMPTRFRPNFRPNMVFVGLLIKARLFRRQAMAPGKHQEIGQQHVSSCFENSRLSGTPRLGSRLPPRSAPGERMQTAVVACRHVLNSPRLQAAAFLGTLTPGVRELALASLRLPT